MREPDNPFKNAAAPADGRVSGGKAGKSEVSGRGTEGGGINTNTVAHAIEFLQDTEQLDGLKRDMYQGYPQAGHDALRKIEFPWPIADIVLQHRECFNGTGFPQGIKGADILIEVRVLAVADAIEDLTVYRRYRDSVPLDQALAEISSRSGARFCPDVVATCMRIFQNKE
jgi:HD-GYP domain-containing protein (c-di-GMP phosphodiesterase class II)